MTINRLLILAVCGAVLGARPANALLPCANYLAGAAAGDEIVLNEAARIAARLIASDWSSPAMRAEAGAGASAKDRKQLVLRQIQRNCQILPRGYVENIVGVLLRSIRPPAP